MNAPLADKLAYYLLKKVNKAIYDYQMVEDGDRVAVAVSGGQYSLSLLRLLQVRQRSVPERYELIAIHVVDDGVRDPGHRFRGQGVPPAGCAALQTE